mgnify:CR=1 FL=1
MRKLFLPLIVFLLVPLSAVLAEANKEILAVSKAVSSAIIPGLWQGFKIMFPFLVLVALVKGGFTLLENKNKREAGKK